MRRCLQSLGARLLQRLLRTSSGDTPMRISCPLLKVNSTPSYALKHCSFSRTGPRRLLSSAEFWDQTAAFSVLSRDLYTTIRLITRLQRASRSSYRRTLGDCRLSPLEIAPSFTECWSILASSMFRSNLSRLLDRCPRLASLCAGLPPVHPRHGTSSRCLPMTNVRRSFSSSRSALSGFAEPEYWSCQPCVIFLGRRQTSTWNGTTV